MLSKAPGKLELTATQQVTHEAGTLLTRKMWLPRLLYDALPWFYLVSGIVAFFATLYISGWFWILPHYIIFSAACIHLAIVIYRRRHRAADPQ